MWFLKSKQIQNQTTTATTKTNTVVDCSSTSVKEGKELIQKHLSQNLLIVFSHYFEEAREQTERV